MGPELRTDDERHGRTYARHRRSDPRIAARVHAALGEARTVLNVGAGTGSYEPADRWVLAVEPSALTFDLDRLPAWQLDHLGEVLDRDRRRFPSPQGVAAALGGRTRIEAIPTPGDCLDGFVEAFWRRPEALLDPEVRSAQSGWTLLPPGAEERIVARLAADLASGAWDAEHGHLRGLAQFAGSVRLVVSEPA
jgi:hypothetical protein